MEKLHASAPDGYKCSDCVIDGEACPSCYEADWDKRHPNVLRVRSDGAMLRRIADHLAALVPVVHNGCPRRVRERHHAILAELSRLLP